MSSLLTQKFTYTHAVPLRIGDKLYWVQGRRNNDRAITLRPVTSDGAPGGQIISWFEAPPIHGGSSYRHMYNDGRLLDKHRMWIQLRNENSGSLSSRYMQVSKVNNAFVDYLAATSVAYMPTEPYKHMGLASNGSQLQIISNTSVIESYGGYLNGSLSLDMSKSGLATVYRTIDEGFVVVKLDPVARTIQVGNVIAESGEWSKYACWSPLGDIAASENKIIKVSFPDKIAEGELPSPALAFHPLGNVLITKEHVCRYDPDTLRVYDVKEHGISYLNTANSVAEFTDDGSILIGYRLSTNFSVSFSAIVYQTALGATNSLLLLSENNDVLNEGHDLYVPLNLGILGDGVYSDPKPVRVVNDTPLPVNNIRITVENPYLDDVEVSMVADPFTPQKSLLFTNKVIMPGNEVVFYVRVRTNPENPQPIRRVPIHAEAQYYIT